LTQGSTGERALEAVVGVWRAHGYNRGASFQQAAYSLGRKEYEARQTCGLRSQPGPSTSNYDPICIYSVPDGF
jgi:hypothetical protein